MKSFPMVFAFVLFSLVILAPAYSGNPDRGGSLEVGPDFDIFFVQYALPVSPDNAIVLGAVYHNSALLHLLELPGEQVIVAGELGFRQYIWQNLHVEIMALPQFVSCREEPSSITTEGFGFTGEVRIGYRFDFTLGNLPLSFLLQFFSGYRFINPKAESFVAADGGDFYWSPIPMFLFGLSF